MAHAAHEKAEVELLESVLGGKTMKSWRGDHGHRGPICMSVQSGNRSVQSGEGSVKPGVRVQDMVLAKQLSIQGGNDTKIWRWLRLDDDDEEVAEILKDYPLVASGDYKLNQLKPGTYAVSFVIMMQNSSDPKVATLKLVGPDDATQEKFVLFTKIPVKKWVTVKVGTFKFSDAKKDKPIKFSMTSDEEMNWKGLIVRGVLIRQN